MYDTSVLYPIVHDISDAETSPASPWCTDGLDTICFAWHDCVVPPPGPLVHVENSVQHLRRTSVASLDSTESQASERSVEDVPPSRPERFQDAYVLTRQIYRGRYSTVWESIQRQSGIRFATKMFDRRTLTPQEDAAATREAAVLEQLKADGTIISCINFYQEATHSYLVTEYAQGGSLQTRLDACKSLSEDTVKKLARSLLKGLVHLHSQDVCHRSLRPDNILIRYNDDGEETTLICDFGSAIHLPYFKGTRGMVTGKCGSAFYASPEVQNRRPYDTQADMWSLGVVLFLALGGSLPFKDWSRRSLLRKVSRAEYIFDPRDWSKVSRQARRFISRLLVADPDERMTAEEALRHSWLALPEPGVAVDDPIEHTLAEVSPKSRKVRFDDVPKPPSKKKTLQTIFSILRRKKQGDDEDDGSISSKSTSSSSTGPAPSI